MEQIAFMCQIPQGWASHKKKRGLAKKGLVCLGKQKMPSTEEIQTLSSCRDIIPGTVYSCVAH